MIDISVEGDIIRAGQQLTSPSVYLDHWALRDISEDALLGTRLTTALQERNGTLALSWLNLCEYSKITVDGQARKAAYLLERNLPRLFFIEIEPFRVIQRENQLLTGGPRVPPHSDESLLHAFTCLKPATSTSVSPFTPHNFFQYTQDVGTAQNFDDLADVVIDRIEMMREELATESSFERDLRRPLAAPPKQAGTRYIIRALIKMMLLNRGMKITRNHAIDLLHAVVPVAYCDFVLLDTHWVSQVDQMRARASSTGLSFPIASVFSRRANGLERFFTELESSGTG